MRFRTGEWPFKRMFAEYRDSNESVKTENNPHTSLRLSPPNQKLYLQILFNLLVESFSEGVLLLSWSVFRRLIAFLAPDYN